MAGGGRRQNVGYEHDSLTFKSDGVIEVKLKLPTNGVTITFKKTKSRDTPVEALISEARCDTLPIQISKEGITIDTCKPLKAAPFHTVTLRFKAPSVDAPTMALIDGRVTETIAGGGYNVIRADSLNTESEKLERPSVGGKWLIGGALGTAAVAVGIFYWHRHRQGKTSKEKAKGTFLIVLG